MRRASFTTAISAGLGVGSLSTLALQPESVSQSKTSWGDMEIVLYNIFNEPQSPLFFDQSPSI